MRAHTNRAQRLLASRPSFVTVRKAILAGNRLLYSNRRRTIALKGDRFQLFTTRYRMSLPSSIPSVAPPKWQDSGSRALCIYREQTRVRCIVSCCSFRLCCCSFGFPDRRGVSGDGRKDQQEEERDLLHPYCK